MIAPSVDELLFFTGFGSFAWTYVYAQLPRPSADARCQLRGTITGPHCHYSRTLPTRWDFLDQGDGPTILARATVVDPCFWTPTLPFLYDVTLELEQHGQRVWSTSQRIGLTRYGTRGCNLLCDGKRWVLRATFLPFLRGPIQHAAPQLSTLPQKTPSADFEFLEQAADGLREHLLGIAVEQPTISLCEWASTHGIPMIADLRHRSSSTGSTISAIVRQFSRYPCIAATIVHREDVTTVRNSNKYLIVAEELVGPELVDDRCENAMLADIAICSVHNASTDGPNLQEWAAAIGRPMFAIRSDSQSMDIPSARLACEQLQADLAPWIDLAGYIV
ncbi:MAG: hypothetical protein R3E01_27990 [Pirellulaceae bacterium]|nr:hypothetical protein [Planctomycetales bacterium]